jgi:hypothetical protein
LRFSLGKDPEGTPERTPKAIHLARRADYLLRTILEQERVARKKKRAREQFENAKHAKKKVKTSSSVPGTPKPAKNSGDGSSPAQPAASSSEMRRLFKPVAESLRALADAQKTDNVKLKLAAIKQHVKPIGDHIQQLVAENRKPSDGGQDAAVFERRLWKFVLQYWPQQPCKVDAMRQVYQKLTDRASTPVKTLQGQDGNANPAS